MIHQVVSKKELSRQRKSICKGPEVGPCFTCFRNSEEPSPARTEQVREKQGQMKEVRGEK